MDTNLSLLLLSFALPLLSSMVVPYFIGPTSIAASRSLALIPLACFILIAVIAWRTLDQAQVLLELPWFPSLGINLTFLIDGLSLFFGLLVTGIGSLIFFYAHSYFKGDLKTPLGQFYCYLLLFMVAMLGTVFAGNLISLFVFWEITGIISFLLIGFSHDDEKSRNGARMALLITCVCGMLMLIGLIVLGLGAKTWNFDQLFLTDFTQSNQSPWFNAALALIFLGAMGKSAQFPFHFWLPNAMSAPTPVSAYLHSATMVKLGVFLCARIFPIFHEASLWFPLLCSIGFSTMCLCAWLALRSHDLKAILAFSTVSQLGFLIGFYGLGSSIGVRFDFIHIMNHACYKACLFMIVGIIGHSCGIRDIRQLGGLWNKAPWLGGACFIACASMIGLPGTIGFISKELMLTDLFSILKNHSTSGWILIALVLLASIIKVAFSARIFLHLFFGKEPVAIQDHWHKPSMLFQAAPLFLAALILILGIFPSLLNQPLQNFIVVGLHDYSGATLSLWHGFTKELFLSCAIVVSGTALYLVVNRKGWSEEVPHFLRFDLFFEEAVLIFNTATKKITTFLSSDRPLDFLPILLFTCLSLVGFFLYPSLQQWTPELLAQIRLWQPDPHQLFTALFIGLSALSILFLKRWTQQLLALCVVGFLITFYYFLYHAPDLALTQILVESALLILILLLLSRFPEQAQAGENAEQAFSKRNLLNASLALGSGLMVTLLLLLATVKPSTESIGPLFLNQTVPLAYGTNAVNTIIVDFRSIDTLGEISVLLIAVLAAIGLVMRYKRTPDETSMANHGPAGFGLPHLKDKETS